MITQRLKNILLYGSGAIGIVVGTALLVAIARGYRYDFLNQQVRQTGLVIIDSQPNGADIFVNDRKISYKTAYRIESADIGQMTVKLQKSGYRDWTRTFLVRPEQVSFLDYAWLLPNTLDYENPIGDTKIQNMIQSSDHRHTFYVTSNDQTVWQYEEGGSAQKVYTPPSSTDPAKPNTIDSMTSNVDGSQLLLHQAGASPAWFIKNVGGQDITNLTDEFKIDTGTVTLDSNDHNQPYWLENGNLHRLNLDAKTVSPVLEKNVTNFVIRDDKAVWSTLDPTTAKLDIYLASNTLEQRAHVPYDPTAQDGALTLDTSRFRDIDYVYILAQGTHQLHIVADPASSAPRKSTFGQSVTHFSTSPSGRYLTTDDRGTLNTYDYELGYYYLSSTSLTNLISWLWTDDNHLIFQSGNRIHLADYDGYNDQVISAANDTVTNFAYQVDNKSVLYDTDNALRHAFLLKK